MTGEISEPARRRALLFGTFDVANYGDLLFPIVAAHRLGRLGWEVVPVSPTMQRTGFADALPAEPMGKLSGDLAGDAVLIGGGEIVHAWPATFLDEYRIGDLPGWAYPSLWLGASLAGALRDVPIVWNAPGVPSPFPEQTRRLAVEPSLAVADYVAVRDEPSHRFLGSSHRESITVVPDTVAGIAQAWPQNSLASAFEELVARKGIGADAALMAVHVRTAGTEPPGIAALAGMLDDFAASRSLTPVLVAIGPSLDDAGAARALSGAMVKPHICLDDPTSLREVAAAIAHSVVYVGNSMHGYITATAYGRPGVIVARPAFRKFAGFAKHAGRPDDVVGGWQDAFTRAAAEVGRDVRLPASVEDALDRHWERVAAAIADPDAGRERRARFLRRYVASGLGASGMGWLLAPLSARFGGRAA